MLLWPPHRFLLLRKMSVTSWVMMRMMMMMMIMTVWISVPGTHEYLAAATPLLPSDSAADFPPSGSEPALSGSGHLSSFLPPPESVDHADGTSGSSGEVDTDMLSDDGAREDEPKAETSSGDVLVHEDLLGGRTETVIVEKREDGGAGSVSPVTQKLVNGTLATGEIISSTQPVSSLLPDGQTMTSTEPTDKAKETGGNETKADKNEPTSSATSQDDGENLITDGKVYGTTTNKRNGSATDSSPPQKWSGSTPVDPASSSSSDSESKVSTKEHPVQAGTAPPGPSLPLHSPKPSAEDSPTGDNANETSTETIETPTKDHTVTKRDFSAGHGSSTTGHSDTPVFDPSSSGTPETFTFSRAPTELLTTVDDVFTTKLDTSRTVRSSPDFKVTSDEALMSSGSRTRRETRFTDGKTMQHTTADFSSTVPSNMESTSVMKSTLLPTASSGSKMTSGEVSDFSTASVAGTTATVQTSPPAGVGTPCASNLSCHHLDHALCLQGICSCESGYYGDQHSDSCVQEPYGLTVTVDNKTCLNLQWYGGDHAYNVTVTSSVSQDATQSEVTKSNNLQMCGFSPGALLTVSVVLSVGGKPETSKLILDPEAPTHAAVSSVNHTCLTITWRPGAGHTDLYILNVSYAVGGAIITINTTTTQPTWTDCGLAPGTPFLIEVFSSSHGKLSQTQAVIGPDSTVPSQPVDGVGQRNDTDPRHCVDLQWTAGPGYRESFHLAGPASAVGTTTTTNSTAATVCSLQPGSLYTFNISASSRERYSQPLEVDACTDPEADWNLRAHQVEATWVTLVWDPPFRGVAVTYVLRSNRSDDNDAAIVVTDPTVPATATATVTGLMSGTVYSFSLTAEFCNRTSLAVPLTVRTHFSALAWANVSAEGRRLEVRWETDQGGQVPVWLTVQSGQLTVFREVVHTSPQFIHTNYSGACFNISLQVANTSHVMTLVQSTEPAAPGEVRNLQAQRLPNDRRALNVTWSPPAVTNGVISHYNVSVRGLRGLQETSRLWRCRRQCHLDCHASSPDVWLPTESDVNDGKHRLEVDELSEYENYTVEVTAYTSAGGGPSSSVPVGGQLLDKVRHLRVDTLNASCLTLSWSPPENAQEAPTTYHVEYQPSHHDDDNDNDNDSGVSSRPVTLTLSSPRGRLCGLQYWTFYQVNVTAVDDQGPGKTDTRRQRTAEHAPGAVANVSLSVEKSIYKPRRLDVSWSAPVHPYGVIRNYFITVRNMNTSELIERRHPGQEQPGTRFNQTFRLVADHHYRVQVFGATGAGNGIAVAKDLVMPAGVLPPSRDTVKFSSLDSDVTSLQADIPTSLLCNFNYGVPMHAGYIVYRPGGTPAGIKDGVSLGHTPVVTSHWTPSHTSFYVDMDVLSLCPSATHGGGKYLSVLLEDETCGKGGQDGGGRVPPLCSGPLDPNTRYHLLVVYCTSQACTYSLPAPAFTTPSQPEEEDSSATGLAAGVTVVLLLLLLGAGAAFYWVYKKKQRSRTAVIPLRSPEDTECRETVCKSRPVALEGFVGHVQQLHRDSNLGFSEEYKTIKEHSPSYSVRAAELTPCKPKNRYTNILPWDRSRVKLIPTDDEEGSDYINASYLPGENHQREFIAAQGPLPSTVDDFWRMTWENRVCVMVMLTQCIEKGKTKCDKYWPDEGVQAMYGDLMVQVRSQSVLPDYIIRVIDVKLGNQSRMIKHFHFMRWPDHGCPEKTSMLLNFVSSVRAHMPHSGAGPTLVHCSAGVGRTGTFIALDRLLLQIRQRSHVDIFNMVFGMREHRMQMVQNENQYVYIHDCLADALTKDQESDDEESENDEDEHIYGNC